MSSDVLSGLLARFLEVYPWQPATAWWRAVEIAHLVSRPFPPGDGLDLGCGDGLLTAIVMDLIGGRRVVGADPDPDEVRLARSVGVYEEALVVSGEAMSFANGSFDWVLSNSVLEHVPDVEPILDEVARVLRPGGIFICTVPSDGFRAALRGPLWPLASRSRYVSNLDRRIKHIRYWSAADWQVALQVRGFTLIETSGYMRAPQLRRWETLSRLTGGILYRVSRRRAQPIAIQRRLGLRRAGQRLPGWAAGALAPILAAGVSSSPGASMTCLLVQATKAQAAGNSR